MAKQLRTLFYSGTSGLVLPVPNKLSFPEEFREKSRLSYYAYLFNSLEVNSSFYKVPLAKTVSRWTDSVGQDFAFTFKLWKGITHNKQLAFDIRDVKHFMEVIGHAGHKSGCLLIQFPASVTKECLPAFKKLLDQIQRCDKEGRWRVSVEFRHFSWYAPNIYELLHRRNTVVVTHDIAPAPPFIDSELDWAYLRFHGPEKGYRGSYTPDHLGHVALGARSLMALGKQVYAYFNNTLGSPIENLRTLQHLIQE